MFLFMDIILDGSVIWTSFSFLKFSMLGGVVIMICGMSFGPFIYLVSWISVVIIGNFASMLDRGFQYSCAWHKW